MLFLFSASIMMLQVACDEDVMAEPNLPQGDVKIVWVSDVDDDVLLIANSDGSNITEVQISLPSDFFILGNPLISSEGKIYFIAKSDDNPTDIHRWYTVSQDGSNLTLVLDGSVLNYGQLGDVPPIDIN